MSVITITLVMLLKLIKIENTTYDLRASVSGWRPSQRTSTQTMPPTPDPASQSIPEYALRHAPIVWLHKGDEFFPSHVVEHLRNVNPKTFAGVDVDVPADVMNSVKALSHPNVNKGDVFLTLDVRRASARLDVSSESTLRDRTCLCSSSSVTILIAPLRKTSGRTLRYLSCKPRTASRIATENHTLPVS